MHNEIQISTNYMFVARFITTVFLSRNAEKTRSAIPLFECVYSSSEQRKMQDEKNAIWILESRERERNHDFYTKVKRGDRTNRNKKKYAPRIASLASYKLMWILWFGVTQTVNYGFLTFRRCEAIADSHFSDSMAFTSRNNMRFIFCRSWSRVLVRILN